MASECALNDNAIVESTFEIVPEDNDELAASSSHDMKMDARTEDVEPAADFIFINTDHCLIFEDLDEYRAAVDNYDEGALRARRSQLARLIRYSLGHLSSVLDLARRLGWLGCCATAGVVAVPITRMAMFVCALPFYIAVWLLFAVHRAIDN